VDAAAVWLHDYLTAPNRDNLGLVPLPTQNGQGVAYAYTWSWGIATRDSDQQALAKDLLAYLSQPAFLGPWTEALGMMPPTASSLNLWTSAADRSAVERLGQTALPGPGAERSAIFGPPLFTAVQAVLVGGATPDSAALSAAMAVQNP
jgi:ABC-type glycerol-3-phosphate transport system substrate-binding protein